MIFVIKVTTNKEDRARELISDKVEKKQLAVYSIARPHGLRGYIFLEAQDRDSAEEAAFNLPYVKGIIGKTVTYDEIKTLIEPILEEINIEKGFNYRFGKLKKRYEHIEGVSPTFIRLILPTVQDFIGFDIYKNGQSV